MAVTDSVADMLTRIRNSNLAHHDQVDIPASKLKEQVVKVLKKEGYIKDFQIIQTGRGRIIRIFLKYTQNKERVIWGLKKISKPGLRVYVSSKEIPKIFGGLGTVIISTPKGVVTDKQARKLKVGGEVLCYVW